jgi:Flp pilus assembly protein TadD
MSLVDDVLIEAERRRGGARRVRGVQLDDLVPIRKDTQPRRRATGSRNFRLAIALLTGLAAIAALAVLLPDELVRLRPTRPVAEPAPALTPPVAAARVEAGPVNEPIEVADPTPTSSAPSASAPAAPSPTATRRPTRVESIAVERTPSSTRLRILTDGATVHRLEHDAAAARLDVVLTQASLVEPNAALDLLDTPIRSLDLRAESPDLRLALELDPEVRVQSRWLALPRGAALVVDLQSGGTAAPDAEGTEMGTEDPLSSLDPMEAGQFAETELPFLLEPEIAAIEPAGIVDQVISPTLGNPAELHIERSRQDRERAERADLRARVEQTLEAARRARAEKRLPEADGLYAEVVLLAPNDRLALVEWSSLLVEDGRTDKAIALLESARSQAPRDETLLIAHARLLGREGDLPRAIALLDGSGLAVTESPDVHVLAAAYHQRAGDHPTAIARYEQILRRFPEESRGWLGLGISLEAVGRKQEARDVYRIALQVGELGAGSRRWVTTRLSALGQED